MFKKIGKWLCSKNIHWHKDSFSFSNTSMDKTVLLFRSFCKCTRCGDFKRNSLRFWNGEDFVEESAYVAAANYMDYLKFLREYNLHSFECPYISNPEKIIGAVGIVYVTENFYENNQFTELLKIFKSREGRLNIIKIGDLANEKHFSSIP